MREFRTYLEEELKDKELARSFREEHRKLRIAYEIHRARRRHGLSQRQLADIAGVTQQMISRLETADAPRTSLRTLAKVAAALDMEIGLVQRSRRKPKSGPLVRS